MAVSEDFRETHKSQKNHENRSTKTGVRVHFLLTCFACADGRFWRGRRGGIVGLRWPDGSGRDRGRVGVAGGCG